MNQNILITGGSSEIGSALIEKIYMKENVSLYSTRCFGNSIKDKVKKEYKIDFSKKNLKAIKEFSSLNIHQLVLIHGVALRDTILENSELNEVLQINMHSSLDIINAVLPGMIERKYGRIVIVGTASLKIGGGETSFSYGLSKSCLKYTVNHLAKHYSKYNVLTNSVSPGFINTKFHKKSKTKIEIKKRIENLNNITTVDQVSNMIDFLLFKNESITGQDIVVDGGDFL